MLKACTHKFMPVSQWMYFDAVEVLPNWFPPPLDSFATAAAVVGDVVDCLKCLHSETDCGSLLTIPLLIK